MKSGNRSARIAALALGLSAGFGAPSLAQKGKVVATSAKIAELAGPANMPKRSRGHREKYGPFSVDVAAALNNLAALY